MRREFWEIRLGNPTKKERLMISLLIKGLIESGPFKGEPGYFQSWYPQRLDAFSILGYYPRDFCCLNNPGARVHRDKAGMEVAASELIRGLRSEACYELALSSRRGPMP